VRGKEQSKEQGVWEGSKEVRVGKERHEGERHEGIFLSIIAYPAAQPVAHHCSIMDSINALMKNKKIQPKLPKGLKPSKNSMKGAANASKEATNLIVNARRGEILSLVSIGVSMLAELYPISPHYNIAIGFFSLYLHHLIPDRASKGGGKQNKFYSDYEQPVRGFFTSFTLVISLSIFVDIDFLSSEQRPHTLDVYDIKINTIEGEAMSEGRSEGRS